LLLDVAAEKGQHARDQAGHGVAGQDLTRDLAQHGSHADLFLGLLAPDPRSLQVADIGRLQVLAHARQRLGADGFQACFLERVEGFRALVVARAWMASSWWAMRSAMRSAMPRICWACFGARSRGGCGRISLLPSTLGPSEPKATSSSGASAKARVEWVSAFLKGSLRIVGFWAMASDHFHLQGGFLDVRAESALVELGQRMAFQFVALVEERQAEGQLRIVVEDQGVLRPGDNRARAHHRRNIAVGEGRTR